MLLAGLYLRRTHPKHWSALAAVLASGALPFLSSLETLAHSLAVFAREWVFNPGPWLLVRWTGDRIGLDGHAMAGRRLARRRSGAGMAWTFRRDDRSTDHLISGSFLVLGGFLITSAAVMPWYLLWVLPLAALRAGTAPLGRSSGGRCLDHADRAGHALLLDLHRRDRAPLVAVVEYLGFFGILIWATPPGSASGGTDRATVDIHQLGDFGW